MRHEWIFSMEFLDFIRLFVPMYRLKYHLFSFFYSSIGLFIGLFVPLVHQSLQIVFQYSGVH